MGLSCGNPMPWRHSSPEKSFWTLAAAVGSTCSLPAKKWERLAASSAWT